MKKTSDQLLISLIPEILQLRDFGHTFGDIYELIVKKYNVSLNTKYPANYLRSFVNPQRYLKYNSMFSEFVLLDCSDDYQSIPVYVREYDIIFTKAELIPQETKVSHVKYDNVSYLMTLPSCLIARRLARIYSLTDSQIINNREKSGYSNVLTDSQVTPENIHQNIISIFQDIRNKFRQKLIEYHHL